MMKIASIVTWWTWWGLVFAGMATPVRPATAAEIALVASSAINAVLDEVVPQFERDSGHKVTMRLGVASFLRKEIEAGAPFDVTILVGGLDGLVTRGRAARRHAGCARPQRLWPGGARGRAEARHRHHRSVPARAAQCQVCRLHPGRRQRRLFRQPARQARDRRRDEAEASARRRYPGRGRQWQ